MAVVYFNDGSYSVKKNWPKSIDIRIYLSGKDCKMNHLKEPEIDPLSISFGVYGVEHELEDGASKKLPDKLNLRSSTRNGIVFNESNIRIKTKSTNVTGNEVTIINKFNEVVTSIHHQLIDCLNNNELHESDIRMIHDKIVQLPLKERYVGDLSLIYLYRSSNYEVWYDENDVEYVVDLKGKVLGQIN